MELARRLIFYELKLLRSIVFFPRHFILLILLDGNMIKILFLKLFLELHFSLCLKGKNVMVVLVNSVCISALLAFFQILFSGKDLSCSMLLDVFWESLITVFGVLAPIWQVNKIGILLKFVIVITYNSVVGVLVKLMWYSCISFNDRFFDIIQSFLP